MNETKSKRGPEKKLEFVGLGKFLRQHYEETRWIWKDVLPVGGLSIFAGKPKVGKSTLVQNLIVAAAKGQPFLSRETLPSRVLYLALEELESELQKRLKSLGATEDDNISIFCGRAPRDAIDQLREFAFTFKPDLIVIDPILRAARVSDSNEYSAVSDMFDELKDLAKETNAHVLCVHHAGKGDRSGADSVLGSTAFHAATDSTIVIGRSGNHVRIESSQRYGEGFPPTILDFDMATKVFSLGGGQPSTSSPAHAAVKELLSQSAEPLTQKEIFEIAGVRKRDAVAALKELVSTGSVKRNGVGGKKDPHSYEILVPISSGEPQSAEGGKSE